VSDLLYESLPISNGYIEVYKTNFAYLRESN